MNTKGYVYTHRNSLIHENRTYRIGDDALSWQDDNKSGERLLYSDIHSVEAQFAPSRVQSNRYLMRLRTRNNGKIDITNTTYKGIGDFEELNESYVPFVSELHRKIAEMNPAAAFKQGSSWAGYLVAIVVTIALVLVIIGAGVFFLTAGMVWVAAIKLAILIFFFPRLLRYVKRNKPGSYDPLKLPADILPDVA
ncbi:hypothetical protein [Mariprofundus sp. KV]|uniref:hypothetical protein n=1 Tax=Mariprofundus sp. KV TaxID=2608715 RepID=UPI0015A3E1E5|nr:hypothetical protein [Mariprofundus sp. KV]NWF35887.1 hypothetical protein [Mariprofundus sp. KV]